VARPSGRPRRESAGSACGSVRSLATRYQLDTADQARLNALVNLAAAEAAIACWNDKYYWSFWRPRAAIREADTDGNPRTIADPAWEPLFTPATVTTPALITPAFPEHPSGHGCLSGAVLKSIANFFGTDKVEITVVAPRSLDGVPIPLRTFDRLSDALEEAAAADRARPGRPRPGAWRPSSGASRRRRALQPSVGIVEPPAVQRVAAVGIASCGGKVQRPGQR
jgi:hypothetical protein